MTDQQKASAEKWWPWQLFFCLALTVQLAATWVPQLRYSLWLDETLTFWAQDGSLLEVLERSKTQGQSALFFLLQSAYVSLVGFSEISFRLPAMFFAVIALYFLFAVSRALFDARAGWFAMLFFAASDPMISIATSARADAAALACGFASVLAAISFVRTPHVKSAAVYGLSTLLTIYFHYLFASILIVHLAVFICFGRELDPITRRRALGYLGVTMLSVLALLLPLIPDARELFLHGDRAIGRVPTAFSLAGLLLLPAIIFPLFLSFAISSVPFSLWPAIKRTWELLHGSRGVFLLSWYIAGPLCFAILAWGFDAGVFVTRYFMWHTAAVAILFGVLAAQLDRAAARVCVVVTFVLAAFLLSPTASRHGEDWRGASAYIAEASGSNQQPPVLFFSGLVETRHVQWLRDPARAGHLRAPLGVYPAPGESLVLPVDIETNLRLQYWQEEIVPILDTQRQLVLYVLDTVRVIDGEEVLRVDEYYQRKLAEHGFVRERGKQFGAVKVQYFQKTM